MPFGKPRRRSPTDVERRMNHYGISRKEASENPEKYPLPRRGQRFR